MQGAQVAEFSAADAAFTGFRIVWGRPLAVVAWAAVQFAVVLGLDLFTAASAGPAITAFLQTAQTSFSPNADPTVMIQRLQAIAPTLVVLTTAQLVVAAVFLTAMNRVVLKPEESRFGYLRLGGDELRQLGLLVGLLAVFFLVYFGALLLSGVLVAILTLVTSNSNLAAAFTLLFVLPAFLCAVVYVVVRFSLAAPATFESGRIQLFEAWPLTRGRFWPILGTYCIAGALWLVVCSLVLVIALLAVMIAGGPSGSTLSIASVLSPSRLVYSVVASIGAALSLPIALCAPATVYQAINRSASRARPRT
jgi:hypothetical protein